MEVSKIQLSPSELELAKNAEVILTKNAILEKTRLLLQSVERAQQDYLSGYSGDVMSAGPKISRGENYLGLPYLVLDFPRLSSGPDLYFIRTMFWWGHFFSSTLHLAGLYADRNRTRIAQAYPQLTGYSFGLGADPWVHHFGPDNYKRIDEFSEVEFAEACMQAPHIKIGKTVSLEEWEEAGTILFRQWQWLLALAD